MSIGFFILLKFRYTKSGFLAYFGLPARVYFKLLSMKTDLRFIALLIVFVSLLVPAGAQPSTISGVVINAGTGQPASNVVIRVAGRMKKTDHRGHFEIPFTRGEAMTVSDINKFHTRTIPYHRYSREDSIVVYLTPHAQSRTNIIQSEGVEDIYHSEFENIIDFVFLRDTLVVLSSMKTKQKALYTPTRHFHNTLTMLKYGERVERLTLPDHVQSLHLDPFNQLFVLGESFYLKVHRKPGKTSTIELDPEYFETQVASLTGYHRNYVYFKKSLPILPMESHYVLMSETDELLTVRQIQNHHYFKDIQGSYRLLTPYQRDEAMALEADLGIDHMFFAPAVRQLHTYTAPHSPVYTIDDQLVIFDDLNGWIFTHDTLGRAIDSFPMHYVGFSEETYQGIQQDRSTGICYVIHEKKGLYYLRKINPLTGAAGRPFKLRKAYPLRLRLFDGWIYYTYRDAASQETNRLVRERLPEKF